MWLAAPQGQGRGQPLLDRHNPDPRRRNRPLVGLSLIRDLRYRVDAAHGARWRGGTVYDPERGRWFRCYLRLADARHLKMHGYAGMHLFGRTTVWTRVAAPPAAPP